MIFPVIRVYTSCQGALDFVMARLLSRGFSENTRNIEDGGKAGRAPRT